MPKTKSIGLCAALALMLSVVAATSALAQVRSHAVRHAKPSHGTVLLLKAGGQVVPDGAIVHVVATEYLFKSKVVIEGTSHKAAEEEEVECETEYFEQGTIHRNLATNSWAVGEESGVDFCEGETWFEGHAMTHPLVLTAPNIVSDKTEVELFRSNEQIKDEEQKQFEKEEPVHARNPHKCVYENGTPAKGHFKSKKEEAPLVAKLHGKLFPSPGSDPGCSAKAKWKGTFSMTYKGMPIIATMAEAPTVTSVTPIEGPESGTEVMISGKGFTGATAVQFGTANAVSYKVNSDTSISATAPAGKGTVDVTVTTPVYRTAVTPADHFTYATRPTVSEISPKEGPEAGGSKVMITGTNFSPGSTVHFGTTAATNVKVNSESSITATSPAGAGAVNVTVINAGGSSAANPADKFTYRAAPSVTEVSPKEGPAGGGTKVTIKGKLFRSGAEVKFGTNSATGVVFKSETELEAESPAGTGTVHVTVTTTGGTSATSSADEFAYLPAPSVSSVTPTEGPEGGSTIVTIKGEHFHEGATVNFGLTGALNVTFKSETELEVESPLGTGTVQVTVTTADGTSTISPADEFTYRPVPTVSEVSPNTGSEEGGTLVKITGTGFEAGAEVKFGTSSASNIKVNSETEIEAESPAGTGTVDVTVTTAGGTSSTSSADEFTY